MQDNTGAGNANSLTHHAQAQLRRRFALSVLTFFLVLIALGLPASLSRVPLTGWQSVHLAHIAVGATVLVSFFLRHRLGERTINITNLSLCAFIGATGSFQYGIASSALVWYAMAVIIAAVALGARWGIITAFFSVVMHGTAGILFITGVIQFPADPHVYLVAPSAWSLSFAAITVGVSVAYASATTFFTGMQELVDEINDAHRTQSAFMANMSHEIRTPLNAVIGFSELLTSQLNDPKHRDYLKAINTAGANLLTIINDILDLSKLEAGGMEIRPTPTRLDVMLREVELIFAYKLQQKGVHLVSEIDPLLPPIMQLDAIRLRQVLINLVGNAVKFTDTGTIRIICSGNESNPITAECITLNIAVSDTGAGIGEDQINEIFEPFRQGNINEYVGGTGLGLSICRKMIELMGGRIEVESKPGVGTTFHISLPDIEAANDSESESRSTAISFGRIQFEEPTVLIVDDVISERVMLQESLSSVGIHAITAENGKVALELVANNRPDLIIMDMIMPELDGLEATRRLKGEAATRNIPVIGLTASNNTFLTSEISVTPEHPEPFERLMYKPIHLSTLLNTLSEFLPERVMVPSDSSEATASASQPGPAIHTQQRKDILMDAHRLRAAFNGTAATNLATRLRATDDTVLCAIAADLERAAASFDIATANIQIDRLTEMLTSPEQGEQAHAK